MLAGTIGLIGALACEGCTYFVAEDYVAPPKHGQVILSPNHAMLLAAPGPLGQLNPQPVAAPALAPHERLDIVAGILDDYGVYVPESPQIGSRPVGDAITLVGAPGEPGLTLSSAIRYNPIEATDWSANPVLRIVNGRLNAQRIAGPRFSRDAVNAEVAFSAPREFTGLNFDVGVVPRATLAREGDYSVRRIGAEFRLGQDIDQRGTDSGLPSWYLFAGADGEAVIFNNGTADRGLGLVNGLQLRDQVTVGDIQAGLSVHKYGTNFAFSYIRREVEYRTATDQFDRNEDFGGLTLSWRR